MLGTDRGVGRRAGHVGDPPTSTVAGQKLTTAVKPKVTFDQAHVDYLKETFEVHSHEAPNGTAEQIFAWVHETKGEERVIAHIQSLINERNAK